MRNIELLILFLIAACAGSAHANPLTVKFRNPGLTLPYEEIEVSTPGGGPPQKRATNCPPGMECMVTIGMPPGVYTGVTGRARNGTTWSSVSLPISYTVPVPTPCSFDADGSGAITGLDFAVFLADFQQGYWTPADFSIFLQRFGKSCP